MNPQVGFLENLAHNCKDQFGENCDQLTVIFPNKRSGMYFARHLSSLFDKPIWSPRIFSFEEFVTGKQDKVLADDFQLLVLLYQAYSEIQKGAETFDAFMPWGEMILSDFNDIDNYLVDPKHIFQVVKSQKELDESFHFLSERDQKIIQQFWKGFIPEPNKKQDEFVKTWAILSQLYDRFNELLNDKNLTYKGRLMRDYAESGFEEANVIWFAGFNALTKAEEKIIKEVVQGADSDVFWEVDQYYFSDPNQESGDFFREYAEDSILGPSVKRDITDKLRNQEKQIQVLGAPLIHGQVMAATQLIGQLSESQMPEDTLVVLSDESMLNPLVQFMPKEVPSYNITMGVTLGQSRVYTLCLMLVRLADKRLRPSFKKFYYLEVIKLFDFGDLLGKNIEDLESFSGEALKANKLNYTIEDLIIFFPFLKTVLSVDGKISAFLEGLLSLLESIYHLEIPEFEKTSSSVLHQRIKHLQTSISTHSVTLDHASLAKLFTRFGNQVKIPASGDIDEGAQIMGILETRNLAFKNVFILGMNEGNWPSNSSQSSFIPYNIRRAFELPVLDHQDAMQSYLFYRLIQNAENITILFNNVTEYNHNGELSRYVQQLKHESVLDIKEMTVANTIHMEATKPIIVKKEGDVLEHLARYLKDKSQERKSLSPSAINAYLECRLRFYYRYIEDLYELDELIEDMDPGTMGNILHQSMEYLYQSKEVWDAESILALKDKTDEALEFAFEKEKITNGKANLTGRHLIAYDVVKKYIDAILQFDQKNSPFEIMGLEEELSMDFPIETLEGSAYVRLKGIIDRIDQIGEVTRIMDYKSGRDDRNFKQIEDLSDREIDKRNKAAFQLFYYSMLYKENHPQGQSVIRPGLFNSKDLFEAEFDALLYESGQRKKVIDFEEYEENFKIGLGQLLTEIFNPMVDFTQTDDAKKCANCPYNQICMRV